MGESTVGKTQQTSFAVFTFESEFVINSSGSDLAALPGVGAMTNLHVFTHVQKFPRVTLMTLLCFSHSVGGIMYSICNICFQFSGLASVRSPSMWVHLFI